MKPVWLRVTYRGFELGTCLVLLGLGALLLWEAIKLGSGWGVSGPDAGFFPFAMTSLMLLGTLAVLYRDVYLEPNNEPFFEVQEEVTDLLKVGLPIFAVVFLIQYLGLYLTSGLYLAFFMAWYGKFRWYSALAGGVLLPVSLWLLLREGFNISMPMSMLYRQGIVPF